MDKFETTVEEGPTNHPTGATVSDPGGALQRPSSPNLPKSSAVHQASQRIGFHRTFLLHPMQSRWSIASVASGRSPPLNAAALSPPFSSRT
jgi:hypothetical protein